MKVLWIFDYEGNSHPYNIRWSGEVCKFLYWEKGLDDEPTLICSDRGIAKDHQDFFKTITKQMPSLLRKDIVAAGQCDRGYIKNWRSIGFGIETPHELRPIILEALGVQG